jgi:phage terminase large subunit-like protein
VRVNDSRSASQRPTLLHLPPDITDDELGRIAVEFAAEIGLELYDWQAWCLRNILARRSDGNWAARESVLEIPRQNGKNSVLEALELFLVFLGGCKLVIHSSYEQPGAAMHFARLRSLIESSDDLMDAMPRSGNGGFYTANGQERIELADGRVIKFKTRTKSTLRGPSPDAIIFDEAMELDARALGSMTPSMSARKKSLLVFTSSSPRSHSTMLWRLRKRALAGDGGRLFYAGWNSDPDVDITDQDNWFRCNPSLGMGDMDRPGKELDAMRADLDLLPPEEFAIEHLGIPEELLGDAASVIPLEQWDSMEDKASESSGRTCLALDVSPDRKWSSICEAGRREDGLIHLEVVDRRPGTDWVVKAVPDLLKRAGCDSIRMEGGRSPARSLRDQLLEAGVNVVEVSVTDHAAATGQMIDFALAGTLRHLGQQTLRSAVAAAMLRASGDAELWARRTAKSDVSALISCTLALGGVPDVGSTPFFVY